MAGTAAFVNTFRVYATNNPKRRHIPNKRFALRICPTMLC